jgi:cysteinyl-tRNA synthetase
MSQRLLGEHIDIHGGGEDLQFPHHENEIAQSEGAAIHDPDKPFVNYWLHNAFVRVDEEKMSKSLGNFFTVREVLRSYDAEVVRFFIARAHYRTPINYSDANLDDARQSLARLYTALKGAPPHAAPPDWDEPHAKRFRAAMDDDFNTPEAVAVLFELSGEANRGSAPAQRQLRALGAVLGLLGRDADAFLKSRPAAAAGGLDDAAIASRIGERREARAAKDFARADAIRRELLENGVVLEDGAGGTTWRRA